MTPGKEERSKFKFFSILTFWKSNNYIYYEHLFSIDAKSLFWLLLDNSYPKGYKISCVPNNNVLYVQCMNIYVHK